ncbi:MAG TPA: hypothetical protein VKZ82_04210 [Nonomuraea sp.]|nr:hypothetical protein [Nonomuraea sp.]
MTNGVRHVLGFVAGVFLPSLILAGLSYSTGRLAVSLQRFSGIDGQAMAVLILTGVGLAFLTSSRLSPVASLLGGLQYLVLGALPLLELSGLRLLPGNWLPYPFASGFMNVGYTGLLFLLGVFLLAVSAFPSRWRGRPAPSAPPYPGPPPADSPYEPWRGDDATRPMRRD